MKKLLIVIGLLFSLQAVGQKNYYDQIEIDFIYSLTKYNLQDIKQVIKERLEAKLQDLSRGVADTNTNNLIYLDNKEILQTEALSNAGFIQDILQRIDTRQIKLISFTSDTYSTGNGVLTRYIHLSTQESTLSKKKDIDITIPFNFQSYCAIHKLSGELLEIFQNNTAYELPKRKIKVLKERLKKNEMIVTHYSQDLKAGKNEKAEHHFSSSTYFYIK